MAKNLAPSFSRKLALEERINSGKKIEGLKGYVPSEVKCCSGSTVAYIPVTVVGIKLADCSFSIRVKANIADAEPKLIVSQRKEDTFTTSPEKFFQSAKEIEIWEDYLKRKREFDDAMRPFTRNNGTLTYNRRKFKEALEQTLPLIRAEIEEEYADKDEGFSKMSREWMETHYKRMMLHKFFPEYAKDSEFDPDNESEDWED